MTACGVHASDSEGPYYVVQYGHMDMDMDMDMDIVSVISFQR